MKKALLLLLIFIPCISFASDESNTQDIPAVNYINTPNTAYPVPINEYKSQGYQQKSVKNESFFVPIDTEFSACVLTQINSKDVSLGDGVKLYLVSDFYYNKKLIAPENSILNGTVIMVKKGKDPQIKVRFSNIATPSGQIIPINAKVKTEDNDGIIKLNSDIEVTAEYKNNAEIDEENDAVLKKDSIINIVLCQPITVSSNNPY